MGNKYKRTFSARMGTKILKFLNPAGPLPSLTWDPNNEEFKEFAQLAGVRWSPLNYEYYYALKSKNPNVSVELLVADFNSTPASSLSITTPNVSTTITPLTTSTSSSVFNLSGVATNPLTNYLKTGAGMGMNLFGIGLGLLGTNPYSVGSGVGLTTPGSSMDGTKDPRTFVQKFLEKTDSIKGKMENFGITDKGINMIAGALSNGAVAAGNALESGLTNGAGYDKWMNRARNFSTGNKVLDFGKNAMLLGISSMNRLGAKDSDEFFVNQDVANRMQSAYNDTYQDLNKIEQGNGTMGLFNWKGLKKLNEASAQGDLIQEAIAGIDEENQTRQALAANVLTNQMNYTNTLNGGIDFTKAGVSLVRQGIKLEHLNRVKKLKLFVNPDTKKIESITTFKLGGTITEPMEEDIEFIPIITEPVELFKKGGELYRTVGITDIVEDDIDFIPIITEPVETFKDGGKAFTPIITEPIEEFKDGGSVKESEELVKLEETTLKNIIPEGALHKNKHHIENTEGLTLKGIPVVDNDGQLQAEIELNEIIFTLEVTKKLEELHKIYNNGSNKERDEAAFEAGKLLVHEILYNTDDRTGLISKCLKGGKL